VLHPSPVSAAAAVPDVIHLSARQELAFEIPGLRTVNAHGAAIDHIEVVKDQLKVVGGRPGQGTLQISLRDGRMITSVVEVPEEPVQSRLPTSVHLGPGGEQTFEAPGITRIEVADDSVAEIVIENGQLRVKALNGGNTTVMAWYGSRRQMMTVTVDPAPAPVHHDVGAVRLRVHMQKVLDVPGLQRIAIGDADIADVKTIGNNQILVIGMSPGTTTLLAWTSDGERRSWEITVTR
jgi:Flp pilus assembly secretin CpaC